MSRQTMQQALDALTLFEGCDAFAIPFKPRTKEEQRWDEERMEEVYEAVENAIAALKKEMGQV